jgi:hypothetical protein
MDPVYWVLIGLFAGMIIGGSAGWIIGDRRRFHYERSRQSGFIRRAVEVASGDVAPEDSNRTISTTTEPRKRARVSSAHVTQTRSPRTR